MGSKISTLSGWELGRRAVDLDDLARLADFYGVSPAALLLTPTVASNKVRVMLAASTQAERLSDSAARAWLEVGRHMEDNQDAGEPKRNVG